MLFLDPPVPSSKVRLRGKTIIASFADAEPAVVWRWPVESAQAAFMLRPDNGSTALLRQQPGEPDMWVASFTTPEAAHKALTALSGALMARTPWLRRIAIFTLSAVGLFVVLYVAYSLVTAALYQPAVVANAAPPRQPAALPSGAAHPAPAPALPPGIGATGGQPPGGRPVDADQLYK